MFGISDPGIWLAYLLALVCLVLFHLVRNNPLE